MCCLESCIFAALTKVMSRLEQVYEKWLKLQPFSNEDEMRLNRKFMLDFNFNSNHIEGNTLTYGQTEILLLLGRVVGDAPMKDFEEMKAHNVGLNMMKIQAGEKQPLTEIFIRQLHRVLLREDYTIYRELPNGLQTSYTVHAGCYKTRPNSVITPTGERFEYASPEETPALMGDLVSWFNEVEQTGQYTPAQLAALFHYRYIRIHPFEDGNGRIARLLVNYILLRQNYPMVVVLSRKKQSYLKALGEADKNSGVVPSVGAHATLEMIEPFVQYMEKLIVGQMTGDMAFLQSNPLETWWFNGELVKFRSDKAISLLQSMKDNPRITIADLAHLLSINPSAVQKQVASMTKKGYISKEGTPKQWHVHIFSTIK